jgi:flagellar motor switch protein FliN
MIADELSQDDIDALLGGLGDDEGDGGADDALSALMGDDSGGDDGGAGAPAAGAAPAGGGGGAVSLPEFQAEASVEPSQDIGALLGNVNLNVKVRLGKTDMLIEDLLRLSPGRVVQLDTMSGEPVDILVNNKVVAKGEVIILNEAFCVRISEIYDTINKLDRQV